MIGGIWETLIDARGAFPSRKKNYLWTYKGSGSQRGMDRALGRGDGGGFSLAQGVLTRPRTLWLEESRTSSHSRHLSRGPGVWTYRKY